MGIRRLSNKGSRGPGEEPNQRRGWEAGTQDPRDHTLSMYTTVTEKAAIAKHSLLMLDPSECTGHMPVRPALT